MKNYETFKGYKHRIVFDQSSKSFVARKVEETGILSSPEEPQVQRQPVASMKARASVETKEKAETTPVVDMRILNRVDPLVHERED
jgi:hypothetical protein